MWESSRIVLPQFREAQRDHRSGLQAKEKPEFDDQRAEELSAALAEAIVGGEATAVTTFGEFGQKTTVGVVLKIDPVERSIQLRTRAETARIALADIVDVSRV